MFVSTKYADAWPFSAISRITQSYKSTLRHNLNRLSAFLEQCVNFYLYSTYSWLSIAQDRLFRLGIGFDFGSVVLCFLTKDNIFAVSSVLHPISSIEPIRSSCLAVVTAILGAKFCKFTNPTCRRLSRLAWLPRLHDQ